MQLGPISRIPRGVASRSWRAYSAYGTEAGTPGMRMTARTVLPASERRNSGADWAGAAYTTSSTGAGNEARPP